MIQFFSEDVEFQLSNSENVITWLHTIASTEGKEQGALTYVFCSDAYLHKMNLDYLQHDTLTDIITFNYNEDETVSGDIFISIDRVKDNAATYNTTFEKELLRVLAHGLLHLIGYNDKTAADQEVMTQAEDRCVEMYVSK